MRNHQPSQEAHHHHQFYWPLQARPDDVFIIKLTQLSNSRRRAYNVSEKFDFFK